MSTIKPNLPVQAPNAKRVLVVLALAGLIGGVVTCVFLASRTPIDVTVSFVGYTNLVQYVASDLHPDRKPDPTNASVSRMAVFQLVNHTRRTLYYEPNGTEIRTKSGWIADPDLAPSFSSGELPSIAPGESVDFALTPPAGATPWRVNVIVREFLTYPSWQRRLRGALDRAGIYRSPFRHQYTVLTSEVSP